MDDIMERTDEQKAAVAARKIVLAENSIKEIHAKRARALRRYMDADATLQLLLDKKKVTKAWAQRMKGNRRYIRLACIAHYIDGISMTGAVMNMNPIIGFR